jgi:hypothetical protein
VEPITVAETAERTVSVELALELPTRFLDIHAPG